MQPTIGHNSNAFLRDAETLADELAQDPYGHKARGDQLIASADKATATDQQSAEDCTSLIKLISTHVANVEKTRVAVKQPYLEATRTIDQSFGALKAAVTNAETKVLRLVREHQKVEKERLEQERLKLEAQAEQARQEAERLRAWAEQLAEQDLASAFVDKDIQEADKKGFLARNQAAAIAFVGAPAIKTAIATTYEKTTKRVVITDLPKAVEFALAYYQVIILEAVESLYKTLVRQGSTSLPGADIVTEIDIGVR